MIPDVTHHTPRIEAYVREDLRGAAVRIDDVLERLEHLSERAVIESFSVESWENPTGSPAEDAATRPRTAVRTTVDEFEDWATRLLARAGGRPFEGGRRRGDRGPIICLAVYGTDGELLAVYPHTDGQGTVRTVEDALDALP